MSTGGRHSQPKAARRISSAWAGLLVLNDVVAFAALSFALGGPAYLLHPALSSSVRPTLLLVCGLHGPRSICVWASSRDTGRQIERPRQAHRPVRAAGALASPRCLPLFGRLLGSTGCAPIHYGSDPVMSRLISPCVVCIVINSSYAHNLSTLMAAA